MTHAGPASASAAVTPARCTGTRIPTADGRITITSVAVTATGTTRRPDCRWLQTALTCRIKLAEFFFRNRVDLTAQRGKVACVTGNLALSKRSGIAAASCWAHQGTEPPR